MVKYVFAPDKVLAIKKAKDADPQKIGEALEKISQEAEGHLTPSAILKAAENRRHFLHQYFEWDDTEAARQWRLEQARSLVQCIHVENSETESGVARAFLSIREKDGTSYRSLEEVLGSADLQAKILAAAERDLLAFESRYRTLNDVCDLIRQAREKVASRRGRGKIESRVQS